MLRLMCAAAVLCWALCIFLNSLVAGQALGGRDTAPPRASSSTRPAPRGLEWRKVRKLGRRVVAVRLQVILA